MRIKVFGPILVGTTLALGALAAAGVQQSDSAAGQGQRTRGMGGFGRFPGGGAGVYGAVTEVAADHYTIRTDAGETYTVHFSVNTRILKQPASRRPSGGGEADAEGGERPQPQPLKPTDIKVGDVITAGGELDATAKSIGAVMILQLDPERAKQMREMQANYGKTWLAGRITAIDGTSITIEGMLDHASHTIVVDENTSFHKRRDAVTLADIQPGEQLRAEGAPKGGAFLATKVTAMDYPNRGEGRDAAPGPPGSPGVPPKP